MTICLITPGQPSNNPRLVKEADALAEAGHNVHAICADCGLWPSLMDKDLMRGRAWTYEYGAGSALNWPGRLRRLRNKIAKEILFRLPDAPALYAAAMSPAVGPELVRAAMRRRADLYIAHHPVALPAAVRAGRAFQAKVGYDVEDLYTGMWAFGGRPGPADRLTERIERLHLPSCDYVTTAAPGFSDVYEKQYGIPRPPAILNVFPLSERPAGFRPGNPAAPLRLYWFSQCIGEKRGLEDVVQALGLLAAFPIELHLRGNWQRGYRETLFARAASAGFDPGRITAHPPAPPEEMVSLASEYDIGLALEQPVDDNRSLCLSNKFFVYLLAGNAVVATGSRGQRPIADTLENAAFSYEPGDIAGLADAIRKWCVDRHALEASRARAWRWGAERYNWDWEKRSFLAIVDAAAGRQTPVAVSAR